MGGDSSSGHCARYLSLLGVASEPPSLGSLRRLVRAHLERVPFENISKLYYLKRRGMRGVPDLALFLDGIEEHNFGGTCYSNNPYFRELLAYLGYDASLCGADMSDPDVHTWLLVRLDGVDYHVDVGYAAPLFEPVRRDLDRAFEFRLGNESWVVGPPDGRGRSRMDHYRDGECIHGYLAKPVPREPSYFEEIIADSFRPDSTFMNCIRAVRFAGDGSLGLTNTTLVRAEGARHSVTRLAGEEEVVGALDQHFGMAPSITREALSAVGELR